MQSAPSYEIIQGHVLDVLKTMPDESVNCVVTSPPYWGLRDYGIYPVAWGGDVGCRHVWGPQVIERATNHTDKRRWNHTRNGRGEEQPIEKRVGWKRQDIEQGAFCECGAWCGSVGLEPTPVLYVEHIIEIFREVLRVMRSDGTLWLNLGDSYATGAGKVGEHPGGGEQGKRWRGDHPRDPKRNSASIAMGPQSQPNRMPIPGLKPKDLVGIPWRVAFALQANGWYLRSDIIWSKPAPMPESVRDRPTKSHEYLFLLAKSQRYYYDHEAIAEPCVTDPKENYPARAKITGRGEQGFAEARGIDRDKSGGFPPRIHGNLPGRSDGAAACNKPDQVTRNKRSVWTINTEPTPEAHFATYPQDLVRPCILAGCPKGGVVLDPFCGSGTTLLVAQKLQCRGIGIELNPDYVRIAERRLAQTVMAL